jgi:phage tail-like protein
MDYPYTKFKFRLEITGVDQAGFSEISGFDANVDVIEYREGDSPVSTPVKLPGLTKYGNITLKWGVSSSMELYEWLQGISEGDIERKTVTITVLGPKGDATASWQLINAWPAKYTAPDFNATASEVAIESLELAHEGMTRTA